MIWQSCLLTGIFGLIIGSFLNVLIYRIPRHKNVAFDRSACPNCGKQIAWYLNIPVLSFLILRGKCNNCKKPISLRYPAVEIINAAMYVYFAWRFGASAEFAIFSALASVLLVIFFIDLDFLIIPDVITLPVMMVGLAVSFLPGGIGIISSLVGLVVGGGALYLVAMIGDYLFKKESMGGGDIKMAGMLGAFIGWKKVLLVFMLSAVVGLVVSLVIMVFSKSLRQKRVVPFGPFLSIAAVVALLYGDQIIRFYVTSFLMPQ